MRKKLFEFRVVRRMSQEQVAKAIGFCRMTYADVENGKREPSLKFCTAFSEAFGVPVSEVVEMMAKSEETTLN